MEIVKCPRCGEEYSLSYRRCPFCEEEDRPRRVRNKTRGGHRVTEKKKTYSGRNALIIILLLVLALLTWVLFGEELTARFAKPEEPPVEEVVPPAEVNDDPFFDPSVGGETGDTGVDVSGARLSSTDFTLSIGESAALKVTGTDAAVVWSSEDSTVAVVGSDGLVTAINPGMTTVTAKVGEITLACIVRVKDSGANTDTSNLKLNKTDFTARVGENVQLKVTGTDAAVTWSVENGGIASVSPDGVVTGLRAGKTNVYAVVGGTTLICVVRIR